MSDTINTRLNWKRDETWQRVYLRAGTVEIGYYRPAGSATELWVSCFGTRSDPEIHLSQQGARDHLEQAARRALEGV
jgi:hypothetical protein